MKERKNGFTLIELLAVIVILAIIALIATPIIMGVIEDARKGANKDATLGYVKAVENTIAQEMIKNPNMTVNETQNDVDKIACTGCGEGGTQTSISVNYQGTKPEGVALTVKDGKVSGTVTYAKQAYDATTGEPSK